MDICFIFPLEVVDAFFAILIPCEVEPVGGLNVNEYDFLGAASPGEDRYQWADHADMFI